MLLRLILISLFITSSAFAQPLLSSQMTEIAVSLPGPWNAEEVGQPREERIQMIVDVIVTQSHISVNDGWYWSVEDLAWATLTKTWYESGRWRKAVHDGRMRGDKGKSVCLGQIMNGHKRLVGTDRESTQRCIAEVMRHLIIHQNRCLNEHSRPSVWSMAKVFSGYGTGHSCSAEHKNKAGELWALQRANTWKRLKNRAKNK